MPDNLDTYVKLTEDATGKKLGNPQSMAIAVMTEEFFHQAQKLWDIDERTYSEYLAALYAYIENFTADDVELIAVKLGSITAYTAWCNEQGMNPSETTSRAGYAAWHVSDAVKWDKFLEEAHN